MIYELGENAILFAPKISRPYVDSITIRKRNNYNSNYNFSL